MTPDHKSQVLGHATLVIDACRLEGIPDTDIFVRYSGPYDESDREYDRGMRAAGTGVNAKEVKHAIVRLLTN